MGVVPLAFLNVIFCFRKRSNHRVALANRVPTAMIEMQVGVENDVNVFWGDAHRAQVLQQFRRLAVYFDHRFRKFVADSGLDQYRLRSSPHHD